MPLIVAISLAACAEGPAGVPTRPFEPSRSGGSQGPPPSQAAGSEVRCDVCAEGPDVCGPVPCPCRYGGGSDFGCCHGASMTACEPSFVRTPCRRPVIDARGGLFCADRGAQPCAVRCGGG